MLSTEGLVCAVIIITTMSIILFSAGIIVRTLCHHHLFHAFGWGDKFGPSNGCPFGVSLALIVVDDVLVVDVGVYRWGQPSTVPMVSTNNNGSSECVPQIHKYVVLRILEKLCRVSKVNFLTLVLHVHNDG